MALVELLGRVLLALIFVLAGIHKVTAFQQTAEDMARHLVPLPQVALVATILIEVGGGAALALGYRTRLAAAALAGFLVIVTVFYHTHLITPQPEPQMISFLKNMGILGGLLLAFTHGAGRLSLDARPRRNRIAVD